MLEEEEGVGVSTGGGAVGCVTIGAGLGSYKKNKYIVHIPNKNITTIKVKICICTCTCTIHNFIS